MAVEQGTHLTPVIESLLKSHLNKRNEIFRTLRSNLDKERVKKLFHTVDANDAWLLSFPYSQAWALEFSLADAFRALAKTNKIDYQESRQEEPPSLGQSFLELAESRYTAVNALKTGKLSLSSGKDQITGVDTTVIEQLLKASFGATIQLITTYRDTPYTRMIETPLEILLNRDEILEQVIDHEERRFDQGRLFFDAVKGLFPPTYPFAGEQTPV